MCVFCALFVQRMADMTSATRLATSEQWRSLLDSVDTVLFDCDGVFWVGDRDPVPGAKEAVQYIRALGKKVCFVSNNSSKSREEYLRKFQALDIEAHHDEVFSTAYVAAHYLQRCCNFQGKVYLIGTSGFRHELELAGIRCIGDGPDPVVGGLQDWLQIELDPEVSAVVVGMDPHFSYMKMIKAASYLNRPGCLFVASNRDGRLPSRGPVIIPGTGCVVSCVSMETEQDPVVVGKPNKPLYDCITNCMNINPSRTLMVGDRLNTDVLFGKKFGMKTLAVLTGITNQQILDSASAELTPDYYANSIADATMART